MITKLGVRRLTTNHRGELREKRGITSRWKDKGKEVEKGY